MSTLPAANIYERLCDLRNEMDKTQKEVADATRNAILDIGIMDIKAYVKEHPEHMTDAMHDMRRINAEKISGPEADIEKLKNIFVKNAERTSIR
jgi:hypothetical protein